MNFYNIRGSAFTDFGAVWDNKHSFYDTENDKLKDLKLSFGFGPRVNMGYFVLKFDTAWQTDLHKIYKAKLYISLSEDF